MNPPAGREVTLDRIEDCDGRDPVSGIAQTPLVTMYGRSRSGEPLALSVREVDFALMMRRYRNMGMRVDLARRTVALGVLQAWDRSREQ